MTTRTTTASDQMFIDSLSDGDLASEISFYTYDLARWCEANAQASAENYEHRAFADALAAAQTRRAELTFCPRHQTPRTAVEVETSPDGDTTTVWFCPDCTDTEAAGQLDAIAA